MPPWPTQSVRVRVYHKFLQILCMASKGTSRVGFHYATFFGLPDVVELLITSHLQDINFFWPSIKDAHYEFASPKFSGSPDLSPIETSWKGDTYILDL